MGISGILLNLKSNGIESGRYGFQIICAVELYTFKLLELCKNESIPGGIFNPVVD